MNVVLQKTDQRTTPLHVKRNEPTLMADNSF